ncbi:MAG TPA: putative lipid II flippase FtsW [Firmicutes bacterium]|uniref:Probable peptidoglycan glycosyltransferase FtsW n=1 Tax=Capillibacterium thermochitinicola TaxID=2699427 RepID=A0A8J6I1B9_9FIRM|nr:putative lipid II flippase FtsW [Capillibacterium thermochitinicola]MBA2133631.1 putative lipid II flippase FtsW [Capillibacterium thermochitinicola]HHW11731.1 putative lipid II flippase FtsW [Bacillota bacterium]
MKAGKPDLFIFLVVLFLLTLGVVMVTSASFPRALSATGGADPFSFGKKQLFFTLLSLVIMVFMINFDYHRFRRFTVLFAVLTPVLLVLVLFLGNEINGARRWFDFKIFNFQPSEFAKLALIFVLAHYLTEIGAEVRSFSTGILVPLIYVGLICGLVMMEPDLGTTIVIFVIFLTMLFAAGVRISHLFLVALFVAPVGVYLIIQEPYRLQRLFTFIDPMQDPQGSGWQILQSLMALGSGGIIGLGLGRSRQKFFYLPEPHNDYIFSIIGEELGLLGTMLVLVLFLCLAWRGYKIALATKDHYGSLLAVGITSWLVIQALINIAVVTATIPATGITLPFLSYGGSSLGITMMAVGILLNISRDPRESL